MQCVVQKTSEFLFPAVIVSLPFKLQITPIGHDHMQKGYSFHHDPPEPFLLICFCPISFCPTEIYLSRGLVHTIRAARVPIRHPLTDQSLSFLFGIQGEGMNSSQCSLSWSLLYHSLSSFPSNSSPPFPSLAIHHCPTNTTAWPSARSALLHENTPCQSANEFLAV